MDLFLVYAVCMGVGLLFTILSAFVSHVFGGHDVSHDAHGELGTGGHAEAGYNMPGFSPFSPTVIASVDNGTRYTAPARVVTGLALPTGQTVKISKIVGSQFYVEAGT